MKSKFGLLVPGIALAASPLLASESFGGIGVSIYQVRDGVKVAEVIPGTPAAETNCKQMMSSLLLMENRSKASLSKNRRRNFAVKRTSRLRLPL